MNSNLEIISLLGVLAAVVGSFFILKKNNKTNSSQLMPLKIQAAERMVLFLERIKPQNLLTRLEVSNLNVLELQSLILHEIKVELDHNLVQQLYLSTDTWERIILASNTNAAAIVQRLNAVNSSSSSKDAIVYVLSHPDETSLAYISQAIEAIKTELKQNF